MKPNFWFLTYCEQTKRNEKCKRYRRNKWSLGFGFEGKSLSLNNNNWKIIFIQK